MTKNKMYDEPIKSIHEFQDRESALTYYQERVLLYPEEVKALHALALLYADQGEMENAIVLLQKAIVIDPQQVALKLHLAFLYRHHHRIDEAEALILSVIAEQPEFAAAYNNVGSLYFFKGEYDQAVSAYQTAILKQPDYIDAYYNLGLALTKTNQKQAAIKAYQSILELDAAHVGAQFQLGILLMTYQDYESAIKHFSSILSAHPHHFESETNIATCYLKLGQLQLSLTHYLNAVLLSPKDTQVLFNLGVIHAQLGHIKEAIHYYLQVITCDANLYDAQYNLGFLYLMMKDKQAAKLHFAEATRIKPHDLALRHTVAILSNEKNITHSPPEYIQSLFDSYADHYDAHMIQALRYHVPELIEKELRQLLSPVEPIYDIVDLGCGTGLCGERVKSLSKTLVGIDLSQEMIALAEKKNCYHELHCKDIHLFLSEQNNKVDVIIAGDVMVYMGDLSAVFSMISQRLRMGGYFIFTAENNTTHDYELMSSGRFSHHQRYIAQLAEDHALDLSVVRPGVLRTQDNLSVIGYIYALRKR